MRHCLEHDIDTQGESVQALRKSLERVFLGYLELALVRLNGVKPQVLASADRETPLVFVERETGGQIRRYVIDPRIVQSICRRLGVDYEHIHGFKLD